MNALTGDYELGFYDGLQAAHDAICAAIDIQKQEGTYNAPAANLVAMMIDRCRAYREDRVTDG